MLEEKQKGLERRDRQGEKKKKCRAIHGRLKCETEGQTKKKADV